MACGTSIKQGKKRLNVPPERNLDSTPYKGHTDDCISRIDLSESKVLGCPAAAEDDGNSIYKHATHGSGTMLVHLRLPTKKGQNVMKASSDDKELLRKSPSQKELNSVQRKKQIADYNSLKNKEERQQRYELRREGKPSSYSMDDADLKRSNGSTGEEVGEPTKRRKRVSFEF